GLIQSVPDIRKKEERLYSISGNVPIPGSVTKGCKFRDRCEFAFDRCFKEDPLLYRTSDVQKTRCFLYDEEGVIEDDKTVVRSEEHTSELQSRFDLVCRLLLEKK